MINEKLNVYKCIQNKERNVIKSRQICVNQREFIHRKIKNVNVVENFLLDFTTAIFFYFPFRICI